MHSLRARLGILVGVLLVAYVVLQILAVNGTSVSVSGDGTVAQPSFVVQTVFLTLATFCVATAVVLVLGIVASFVVEEAFVRRLEIEAAAGGGNAGDETGEPSEPRTDPETR